MLGGSTGKIQQLFSDHVIKCRFEPVPELDVLASFALLNPNLVHFSDVHRRILASIMMPHNRFAAQSQLDSVSQASEHGAHAISSAETFWFVDLLGFLHLTVNLFSDGPLRIADNGVRSL